MDGEDEGSGAGAPEGEGGGSPFAGGSGGQGGEAEGEEGAGLPRFARNDGEASLCPHCGQPFGRVQANKGRELQAARTGGRKLFDAARREVFLEWLAATANVRWSAEKAGIAYQTVWKHRMNDPVFAEAFDRALEQGVVRGRARLIEMKKPRIDVAGNLDSPELDEIDPQVMLAVLREHEAARGGPAAGMGRKQGRRPRIATNAEVRAALVKRLAAYGVRLYGELPSPEASAAEAAPDEGEGE